ncbi:pyridoxal phosphate-dependent decarboxylase family protein [Streptomyces uncialis]|uniref:pyridoxal phosphate-dependent decarboxylase family protein n=1 Tax=Streptomyces uncialis TaxID=1048205 RepID=UPI00378C614B
MRSHLLHDTTTERYRRSVTEGIERVATRAATTGRQSPARTPEPPAPRLAAIDLDRPLGDTGLALDELDGIYLRDTLSFRRPRYLAHLHCPVVIPAAVGEAVLAAVDSPLATRDPSAGGALIERRLIDWTAGRLGLGPAADGVFTGGGTRSTVQALTLALARTGDGDPARLRVLASEAGHFGVRTAAGQLGLGPDAVITVPGDPDGRMRVLALARELARCERAGLLPMAVVATAGSTDFGSIDPLPEIAALCARYGVWLHVDASYSCGLLASRRNRHRLAGIEHADSVTVDYHKSFFQPVGSRAVLVRDGSVLRPATPLPGLPAPRGAGREARTARRFDALTLWMTLRVMGADAVGDLFDEVCDLATEGWRLLDADPRFEVLMEPALSTLVFRYLPPVVTGPADIDRANLHARKALFDSGDAVLADTKVGARRYLKLTLLDPATTPADLGAVLDLISRHAERYLAERLGPIG